jgi:hypothetical protein
LFLLHIFPKIVYEKNIAIFMLILYCFKCQSQILKFVMWFLMQKTPGWVPSFVSGQSNACLESDCS